MSRRIVNEEGTIRIATTLVTLRQATSRPSPSFRTGVEHRYRQFIRLWRARRAFSKSSTILSSEVPAPPSREFIHRRPVIGPPMLPIPIV